MSFAYGPLRPEFRFPNGDIYSHSGQYDLIIYRQHKLTKSIKLEMNMQRANNS